MRLLQKGALTVLVFWGDLFFSHHHLPLLTSLPQLCLPSHHSSVQSIQPLSRTCQSPIASNSPVTMADPPVTQDPLRLLTDQERDAIAQLRVLHEVKGLGIEKISRFIWPCLVVLGQPELACSIISTCAGVKLDHADIQDDKHVTVAHFYRDAERAATITIWVGRTTQNRDERQRLQQFSQRSSVDSASIAAVSIPTRKHLPNPEFTAHDIKILRRLAWGFFKGEHNTLLVVPATHDYRDQNSWKLAKELDPSLERTVGVLTHLEQVEPGSESEAASIRLMKNEQERLQHGWVALCSEARGEGTYPGSETAQSSVSKRDPWNSIPKSRFGIESLVNRLESIIGSKFIKCALEELKTSSDALRAELIDKARDKVQDLRRLGDARTTASKQREALLQVSERFSRLTEHALNGVYLDEFLKNPNVDPNVHNVRKLRTVLRDLSRDFADVMRVRGCTQHVVGLTSPGFLGVNTSNPYIGDYEIRYVDRKTLDDEVAKDLQENGILRLPGSVQTAVAHLFRRQSSSWEAIAKEHLLGVWETTRYFASCALRSIVDVDTSRRIMDVILDPKFDKVQVQLLTKLEELSRRLRREHLSTAGVDLLAQIRPEGNEQTPNQRVQNVDNNDPTSSEIINRMQMYYNTTVVTFVDNIANLAVENCALEPLASILTCQDIIDLEESQLANIVGETPTLSTKREKLRGDFEKLQAALCALESLTQLPVDMISSQTASIPDSRQMSPPSSYIPRRRRTSPSEPPRVLKRRASESSSFHSLRQHDNPSSSSIGTLLKNECPSDGKHKAIAPTTIFFPWREEFAKNITGNVTEIWHTITFIETFKNHSLQEIRLADYKLWSWPTCAAPPPAVAAGSTSSRKKIEQSRSG